MKFEDALTILIRDIDKIKDDILFDEDICDAIDTSGVSEQFNILIARNHLDIAMKTLEILRGY